MLGFLVAASVAKAGPVIAYENAAVAANQGSLSGSAELSLGLSFYVNQPITISYLGAFDSGNANNLNGLDGSSGVTVQIFQNSTPTTGTPFSPSVKFTSASPVVSISGDAGDAFLPISPTTLPVGEYTVVAFNDNDYNCNSPSPNQYSTENRGGGAISFAGTGLYLATAAIEFPTTADAGPENRYDAGTFVFSVVPDGGLTAFLLGGAFLGLGVFRRKYSNCR